MKYLKASILALLAVMIAVCLQGCAEPDNDMGTAYAKLDGTTLVISGKPGFGKVVLKSAYYKEWRDDITKVIIEDEIAPTYTIKWFAGMSNLTTIEGLEHLDVSHVTSMYSMFKGCKSLQSLDGISAWDTSSVTQMGRMFYGCQSLTSLDLGGWDVSNVRDMSLMFAFSGLTEVKGLENWNVAKVRSADQLFMGCKNLQNVGDLNHWEFPKDYQAYSAFDNCTALLHAPPHWAD